MKLHKPLLKVLGMHLSLIFLAASCALVLFFHFILPLITKHGQFITVPDLKGVHVEELDILLPQRSLRFEITKDIAYSEKYPPQTVLQQYPKPGSQVKEYRKLYLTLNAAQPPRVKVPNLIDGSVRNALELLKSHGLLVGKIKYVPDVAKDAVLEQWHKGNKIEAGELVFEGENIDLVVGGGLGEEVVEVPDVIGKKSEEAVNFLLTAGIKVGAMFYEAAAASTAGVVLRQIPSPGTKIKVGDMVDLWLSQ